jgi:hypothetical protein
MRRKFHAVVFDVGDRYLERPVSLSGEKVSLSVTIYEKFFMYVQVVFIRHSSVFKSGVA